MYGDFSLHPFAERPDTSRVLMQQGRVLLDSDWNAQVAASTSMLRSLAQSILGPWAASGNAFHIGGIGPTGTIEPGIFWVDGLRCTNPPNTTLQTQSVYKDLQGFPEAVPLPAFYYLEAWEQSVSTNEDDSLREVALGGADTTLRSEIRWVVRALPITPLQFEIFIAKQQATTAAQRRAAEEAVNKFVSDTFAKFRSNTTLTAEAAHHDSTDACLVAPDAKYRGVENQLYRVEVYRGTHDAFGNPIVDIVTKEPLKPIVVWSRDNGSVALPIDTAEGRSIEVASLGRDDRTRLQPGALVQVVDRYDAASGHPRPLIKVTDVSDYRNLITIRDAVSAPKIQKPAILRRWDGGPVELDLTKLDLTKPEIELDLENDIVVTLHFDPSPHLRTGDYWVVPARTAIGDVIWPRDQNNALVPLPPMGIQYAYAPLAAIGGGAGTTSIVVDVRSVIERAAAMVF